MKVATKEIENSQIVLDIEVEDDRFQKAVDQAYRRIVNRINVPGFRRGKAPRALVERMVGREALVEDAVEHLVPEVVEAAVKEQDIKMVARPRLEVVSTEPLQVKATVPVQPKVELGDYRSLTIEREEAKLEDGAVDRVLDQLRDSHATWEPVEREAQQGDRVAFALHAEADGQVVTEASDAEYVIDPDGPEPAPGFANQIVGMSSGEERSFVLTLPDSYRRPGLAGQPATFDVTLHWVKERRLPDIDDEFAKTVGTEFETAAQLREHLHDELLQNAKTSVARTHEDRVIQEVVDLARVELPPQLVEEETDRLAEQLGQRLDRQGITREQYLRITGKTDSQLRDELSEQANRSARRTEVLDAVAHAEAFEVTEDEILQELVGAETDPAEVERAKKLLETSRVRDRVASLIRQRRAARFLLETVGGVTPDDETEVSEASAEAATATKEPGEETAASDSAAETEAATSGEKVT